MRTSDTPLRVGVVGCGEFGPAYALNVIGHPDARLASLCDVDIRPAEVLALESSEKGD